jgi:hypothetical protein
MEEDELINVDNHDNVGAQHSRPFTVRMLESMQSFLDADRARLSIVKLLTDGEWHDLTSLVRVARKYRPIGQVGVGMAMNQIQSFVGFKIFETDGQPVPETITSATQLDSAWRIRDEFMGIIRAVVSTMDSSDQESKLTSTLERVQLQNANRSGGF